ncbi:MAG TPA: NosD domain-containing protein [Polyangiaceae bacterium]|nr:NosD domain-containing protein [Polyangiaceae bacterium]
MSRKLGFFALTAFSVAACSLINAPDDLKPVEDAEGGSGDMSNGGSAGSGAGKKGNDGGKGGTTNQGDGGADTTPPNGGTGDVGAGGCGDACSEGGAPPIGRDCDVSADDCSGAAPICDASAGECRPCADSDECASEVGRDFCVTDGKLAGRCVECTSNDDCNGRTPICGDLGVCRGCGSDDECDSGVCNANGACALPATAVYALAETGLTGLPCGTFDQPCRFLADATGQLTTARSNLVLIKTIKTFNDGINLPAVKGLRIVGNGVSVSGSAGGVVVPAGATVAIDNIVLAGSTADDAGGVVCTGGSINVTNSILRGNTNGIYAKDCDVVVSQSLISANTPTASGSAGITSVCTAAHCDKTTSIVRNKFIDNGQAIYLADQLTATIENNLFLRNGYNGYTRVLELRSDSTRVGYNTLVENFNNGIYVGIVACIGGPCDVVGNIAFNNFPGHPEYADQVMSGGTLTYNLTEATYPGATNRSGDPKFVDASKENFTPGPGSPAIDNGNPSDYPPLDINGKKRGSKPDIGAYESN